MGKFTPGPWLYGSNTGVVSKSGKMICDVNMPHSITASTHRRSATLVETKTANGRLIAAAPEMLEALEALLDAWVNASNKIGAPIITKTEDQLWERVENIILKITKGDDST